VFDGLTEAEAPGAGLAAAAPVSPDAAGDAEGVSEEADGCVLEEAAADEDESGEVEAGDVTESAEGPPLAA